MMYLSSFMRFRKSMNLFNYKILLDRCTCLIWKKRFNQVSIRTTVQTVLLSNDEWKRVVDTTHVLNKIAVVFNQKSFPSKNVRFTEISRI
jgi:hypothetical protein